MAKFRKIPAIVMLLGGTVTCIVTYINNYALEEMLIVFTFSLLIFLILGLIIQLLMEAFEPPVNIPKVGDDGEVVEKQPDEASEEVGEADE